jgi:hypothetical protein
MVYHENPITHKNENEKKTKIIWEYWNFKLYNDNNNINSNYYYYYYYYYYIGSFAYYEQKIGKKTYLFFSPSYICITDFKVH